MPDPCDYDTQSEFVSDCVSERQTENPNEDTDQSVAICSSMWRDRECASKSAPRRLVEKAGAALEVGDREAIFVVSTNTVDRAGDIVEQDWDFRQFRRNPVFLFQHEHQRLPIGKVARVWTDQQAGKTFARMVAPPPELDEFANKVWRFLKEGFLSAVSVGFRPLARPEELKDKKGRWTGYRFPRNELLEISLVSVPANAEATVIARSWGMADADFSKIFLPRDAVPGTPRPKSSPAVRAARRRVEIERLRVR